MMEMFRFKLGIVYTDAYICKKKIIELYILNWYILVYVNYILIKLIFLKGSWAEKEHSN